MSRPAGPGALSSRSVTLRPLLPSDGEWFYALMCGPAGERWRYRGRTPSHDSVAADMWRGVFAQFVVTDPAMARRLGIVGFYNVALEANRAHLFAVADVGAGAAVTEGAGLLCAWGFEHHGFDRIFIETAEFNLRQFGSLGDAATVEGRLRNYDWWAGRYWDMFILSITVQQFQERFATLLASRSTAFADDGATAAEVHDLVEELWPLDSLGLVEVLDVLERHAGGPIDAESVVALTATDSDAWARSALALAGASQALGSAASPPEVPSGSGASSRPGPTTSTSTVPDRQRIT